MVDENDLALDGTVGRGAERIDAVEIDDLAGDASRAGRAAVAERGDGQLLREGGDDLGAFGAASPHRHGEGLDMDVGEAEPLELSDGPRPRASLGLGCRQALPDLG